MATSIGPLASLTALPTIGATNHCVLIVESEIMYVTAHTAAANTATVVRGQEGTAAVAHTTAAWTLGEVVSDFNSLLGYTQVVANQTPITVAVDLTSLTLTVTVPYAGHRIKITGYGTFANSVNGDGVILTIMEGATQLSQCVAYGTTAAAGFTAEALAVVVPTAASHTYKLQAAQAIGGTVTLTASATTPAFIMVEDKGPAL